ncbi:hypothetical protein [Streptomyces murinus]|uniref:pPIWI_RE_Y domain-containing protein n=1 Tax=Streptomyces murinus TaxID=33900 RepID=UPI002113C92C|nr:hypothetical protein [Streptomyces murinus]
MELLAAVSRGLIDLAQVTRVGTFRLPYPPGLQLALDRVVLAGLTRSRPVPGGIPELLSWSREKSPAEWWPLELPDGFLSADARLLHSDSKEITRTCAELASWGPDGVLEQEAVALLAELAEACGTVERFTACRDFLIQQPVILQYNPVKFLSPAVAHTWKLVQELYGAVPDRFQVDGRVYRCSGCSLLARPLAKNASWCEGGCRSSERVLESTHQPEQSRLLPLALRLFLALPGRTEQAVRSGLPARPRLLPRGLGLLELSSTDGTTCVLQVQARQEPVLAALQAAETAAGLAVPFHVVTPHDLAADPGYREAFEGSLPDSSQIRLLSADEFTTPRHATRTACERNDDA